MSLMNVYLLAFLLIFSTTGLHAMSSLVSLEQATLRLFTGVNPVRRPVLHKLQKEFFIENRKSVTVERISERVLYVHDDRLKENEGSLVRQSHRELALFKTVDGRTVDRRSVVEDHLKPHYRPIAFLRMIYNITPRDSLIFRGTGFRNGLNQIVTAGHNLSVDEKLIKRECDQKKIFLKDYRFNRKHLTIETFFGFREAETGEASYTFFSRINGLHSFTHEDRDFGIVSLPIDKSSFLDEEIGALGFKFLPDQPHEYTRDEVSIVGYPGEKKPIAMHSHKGPIRSIDHNGIVYYEVDTSSGNSGSPGILELKKDDDSNIENFPVCLVHTHRSDAPLNAGEKIDEDTVQFMKECVSNSVTPTSSGSL